MLIDSKELESILAPVLWPYMAPGKTYTLADDNYMLLNSNITSLFKSYFVDKIKPIYPSIEHPTDSFDCDDWAYLLRAHMALFFEKAIKKSCSFMHWNCLG